VAQYRLRPGLEFLGFFKGTNMKKLLAALSALTVLSIATLAMTDDNISIATGIIGAGRLLGAKTADNQTTVGVLGVDSNGNTTVQSLSGKSVTFPGAVTFASGAQVAYPVAVVITPATSFPTPSATGSLLVQKHSIIAAGAPTATFVQLPLATASVGKTYSVFNQASQPAAIVPISGDTQGVSAAATPFICTTLKSCDCTALTSANWMCGLK
jgi:hypothetical protein